MERNCFGALVNLNVNEISGSKYINCLIRDKSLLLLPEEEVRQAVLNYLFNHSGLALDRFATKVEYNSLDIVFYLNYDFPNFSPSHPPVVIFELKRDLTNLYAFTYQLENYMSRHKCAFGVLTNSAEILFIEKKEIFEITQLNILQLEEKINKLNFNIAEDIKNFELAQQGEVESFIYLIKKFGKTSKFIFECKEYPVPINGFFFDVFDGYILFNFCNINSTRKRPKILKYNFLKLISIYE